MKFTHYDLGYQDAGTRIKVNLTGNAANVCLLDDQNFRAYRQRRRYSYHGGLARSSPCILETPRGAKWHVVVDLDGLGGSVRSTIEVQSTANY